MQKILIALLAVALVCMPACGSSSRSSGPAPSGNFILVAFDNDGTLHVIDASTAATISTLATFHNPGTGNEDIGRVSGCIWNPVVAAIWLGMGGNAVCPGCIMALNGTTGEATVVDDTSMSSVPGLAISSANRIFAHEGDSSGFYEFNNTTGVRTSVNATTSGTSGNGLTFGNDGVLYLCSNETLWTIDQTTYDATSVAALSKTGFPTDVSGEVIALATRASDGVIFGIWKDGAGGGGGGADAYLVTIDTTTGAMTYVGTLGGNFDGLAMLPAGSVSMT